MSFDYYQPAGANDALGPNRRAAVMMFIVGGLALLGAFCCAGVGAMVPQMMVQDPAAFAEIQAQFPQADASFFRIIFIVLAVLSLIAAAALIVLGVFVKRGSKAAVITSIVLVIFGLLYLVLNILLSLGMKGAPKANVVCFVVPAFAVLVFMLILLFPALRGSHAVRAMREQHMQQYWQYAYQQQMYSLQQQQQQQQPPMQPPGGQPQQPQQPQQTWPAPQSWPPPQSPPPPPQSGGSDADPPPG
jgi:hypothetical protein